jgi:uncharacterized repeat protein (TIGR04138 family)
MHSSAFQEAVNNIVRKDSRFDPDAYLLVKEALDFTVNRAKEQNKGANRHVSGPELLEGFRDFTLENFGPMSITLLREWGIRKCSDVGTMVFNLINEQVFGKQESDTPDDFDEIFQFDEAFVNPFLPHEQGIKPIF